MKDFKVRIWMPTRGEYAKSPVFFEDRWFSGWCDFDDSVAIENPVVELFTGRRDKNGREIYDGDRFREYYYTGEHEDDYIDGTIRWIDEEYGFRWCVETPDVEGCQVYNIAAGSGEVIGNIHDKEAKQ